VTIPPNPHPEQVEAAARYLFENQPKTSRFAVGYGGWNGVGGAVKEAWRDYARGLASLANRPADDAVAMAVAAVRGIADDYQTSEKHHPNHVLLHVDKFEPLRLADEALAIRPGGGSDIAALREALAERDSTMAVCPFVVGRPPKNAELCSVCNADSSEPCRKRVIADHLFVEAARAALPPQPEGVKRP
jgi:hypothetical protein